jgi:hypothetical protein
VRLPSNSEVATFRLDDKKGVFIKIWSRQNELVVINGGGEYTALVIKPGQAEITYDLVSGDATQPLNDLLAGSAGVQQEIKDFLIRNLHHVGSGPMKENLDTGTGAGR